MFHIDSTKCTGCGACLEVCPRGAISLRGDRAEIDPRRCTECGMCLEVCPVAAIREVVPQLSAAYETSGINREGREVNVMRGRGWFGWGSPGWGGYGRGFGFGRGYGRGFGRGFGRGLGYGRGFGRGFGRGLGYGRGFGRGFGRWSWATPYAGYYGMTAPYRPHGDPYYSAGGPPYYTPYSAWGWY
jgi:NAD-dependent dihydropyrimidine dehydrogenase PreA subunit